MENLIKSKGSPKSEHIGNRSINPIFKTIKRPFIIQAITTNK